MGLFDVFKAVVDIGTSLLGAAGSVAPKQQQAPRAVAAPAPVSRAKTTAPGLDPRQGAAVSASKRRKRTAAQASGRSSLRIDLVGGATDDLEGRSGIRIA